jgi:protein-disulfide isomerase
MHAPTLGPAEAPVTIVEFLDPACETCAAFYPRVKQLLAAHPERIRLVLRWAPFHPGSDKVVAAIEAARRQGKLWPALEALLTSQREWTANHRPDVGRALARLQALGLDMERLSFDMTAPEIAIAIAQDVADAQTLNVTKTPEFFVNGKPLPRFGWDELQTLVAEALAR